MDYFYVTLDLCDSFTFFVCFLLPIPFLFMGKCSLDILPVPNVFLCAEVRKSYTFGIT